MSAPAGDDLLARSLGALRDMRAKLEALEAARTEPIAVVGIGCRYPGGVAGPDDLWRLLVEGRSGVGPVPDSRWRLGAGDDEAAADDRPGWPLHHAALLDRPELFDPYFFGISPREAAQMDPQQRLFLEVAWHALEDAGFPFARVGGSETGVFVGANASDYLQLQLSQAARLDTYTLTGGVGCIIANRLSYLLDLRGPSLTLDTACSSSLVAVHLACQSLRLGECSAALVAGMNVILSRSLAAAHAEGLPLAADGHCKTFDARADGYVRAEGCGVVVLERLSDALARGDRIRAVIAGSAVNQDGLSNGMTAPSGSAQRRVIRAALDRAGVAPASVGLVETHGTGTALGDPIEVEALREVYGGGDTPCALGSLKTNLGHLEAGAGVAGLIKAVLAIEHGAVPANLHFESPNPLLAIDGTRLFVPTALQPWEVPAAERRAAVSSFGAGGTNAHVVVAGAPATTTAPVADLGVHLLVVSARSQAALVDVVRAWADLLESGAAAELPLAAVCAASRTRRTHHPYRAALVGRTREDLVRSLRGLSPPEAEGAAEAGQIRFGIAFGDGEGPDEAALGSLLAEPRFAAAHARAAEALERHAGWSIDRPPARVSRAEVVAARRFAHAVALAVTLRGWGAAYAGITGTGVGEIAAVCAAGVLDLDDAARLVVRRGALLARAGARARSGSAALALRTALEGLAPRAPSVPVVAAALGRAVAGPGAPPAGVFDERYWADSVGADARLEDGVACLEAAGIRPVVELGPDTTLASLLATVGALHVAGASIDFAAMGDGPACPLPLYPFEREPFWFERAAGAGQAASVRPTDEPAAASAPAAAATAVASLDQVRAMVEREVGQLLGFGRRRVEPTRGFFQMGMDSMMASRLRNRLEVLLGRKFPVSIIFEHPTVVGLARFLAGEPDETLASAPPPAAPEPAAPVAGEDDLLEVLRRELDEPQAETWS